MIQTVMKLEWLRLRRSPVAQAILVFALVTSLYSVWSGVRWAATYQTSLDGFENHIANRMETWRSDLEQIEAGEENPSPYAARPMDIRIPATHQLGDLGHLAIGYRDITPARLQISTWRNDLSMVERYEFDNPTTLALGSFDFAFFVIVVLPVLMIALSFDVIAADRTSGRAKLLLANPISENKLVLTRLFVRNGLLAGITLVVFFAGVGAGAASSLGSILQWLLMILGYMIFWFALINLIVAKAQKSEGAAAGLVAAWIMIVFAIPSLVDTVVEAIYPPPSKLAYLSIAREAEGEASKQTAALTEGFLADHPDLSVGDENVPGFYRGVFLSNASIREETSPIAAAFRENASRREKALDILQYLSPAVTAQRALYSITTADMESTRRFLEAGSTKLSELSDTIEPAVVSRNRISLDDYSKIKPFEAPDAQMKNGNLAEITVLFLSALSMFGFAQRRTNKPLKD